MSPPDVLIERGKLALQVEADAVLATRASLGASFADAVRRVLQTLRENRKLIFSGVGKNTPIAQKLTATFNSIGAPACYLDPTQALHGDLGLCEEGDLALLFSNSGQSEEVLRLLPLLHRFNLTTIGITSRLDSPLARDCSLALTYEVPAEACPLQIAPTASTTATLALGDALAMTVMQELGLTRDDFARHHPGGALGRSLLLRARDLMRTGDRLALGPDSLPVQNAILAMTEAKSGSMLVTGSDGRLTGIFTDGDFRRAASRDPAILSSPVSTWMTRNPITVRENTLLAEAFRIFEQRKIDDLPVVDEKGRPLGVIDIQDLPKVKIF